MFNIALPGLNFTCNRVKFVLSFCSHSVERERKKVRNCVKKAFLSILSFFNFALLGATVATEQPNITELTADEASQAGFDELVTQIERLMPVKHHVVVGVSEFGGAGKSHLADRLRDNFEIKDEQIVRIDSLYGANPNGDGIFDQSDWPLLARILENVHAGKRLQYQGKDHKGEAVHCDEALPNRIAM
jgi:hypothetical protein